MKLQILGSGCPKCRMLEQRVREAVAELKVQADIEKVTEVEKIVSMGVMMTPALAVNGVVRSVGRVLSKDQVISLLQGVD